MRQETDTQGDEDKLKELILYIAQKCSADPDFGAVVLNKVLFFSDFLTYAGTGRPITGVEYQKLPHGPAPRRLLPLQRELTERGEAVLAPADRMGFRQKRLVALRQPDLSAFTGTEIAVVDGVIDQLRGSSATRVSQLSHAWSKAWEVAEVGETIPYETVFVAPSNQQVITPEIELEAKELAEHYPSHG